MHGLSGLTRWVMKETDSPRPMAVLILKHASASRISGEWNDDDYDVLADGAVVGRIMRANAPIPRTGLVALRGLSARQENLALATGATYELYSEANYSLNAKGLDSQAAEPRSPRPRSPAKTSGP